METSSWYVVKRRLAWIKMHEQSTLVTGVCGSTRLTARPSINVIVSRAERKCTRAVW